MTVLHLRIGRHSIARSVALLFAALLMTPGALATEQEKVSATQAKTQVPGEKYPPPLKCKVLFCNGYFASYSINPGAGDTTTLDVSKMLKSDYAPLYFKGKEKTYIPLMKLQLKVVEAGLRLESTYEGHAHLRRIDVVAPRARISEPYTIYVTYENEGLTRGVLVMEGRE